MARALAYVRRHHVGLLALFIAFGGTSYAASQLPKNSVGPRQIRTNGVVRGDIARNAVDSSKVGNGTLEAQDFKPGQIPGGPRGPQGAPGPVGSQGQPGNFSATLQSGQTLTGTWAVRGYRAPGKPVNAVDAISLPVPLTVAPITAAMKRAVPGEPGEATAAQCPGSVSDPQAAAGILCLYEESRFGAASPGFCNPTGNTCNNIGTNAVSRTGMVVQYGGNVDDATFGAYGTWAVTAP